MAAYHFLLDKRLERINLAIVASLDELDFSKGTLADNLERGKVVRLLLCSQKPQVFNFGAAHAGLLARFPAVGNGRLLHQGLEFECSASLLILERTRNGIKAVLPLVPIACSLDAVLEEGIDEALGNHGLLLYVLGVFGRVPLRSLLVVQRNRPLCGAALTTVAIPSAVGCARARRRVRRALPAIGATGAAATPEVLV